MKTVQPSAADEGVDLLERLEQRAESLTPQERRLAKNLVEQLYQWGYLSSAELAAQIGVHRSTVVRFAQHLGFAGYPELQASVREWYLREVSTTGDLVMTDARSVDASKLQAVYQRELENLQRSYTHLDIEALNSTALGVANARKVLVFGRRFSFPIALHISLVLKTMRDRVDAAPGLGGSSVDQLFDLTPDDFVLVVSLRRHSKEVQRTLQYLAGSNVPVTMLTDATPGSDSAGGAMVLRAHIGGAGVLDSYTALTSVSHLLLTLVASAIPAAEERLSSAEKAWRQLNHG